MSAQGVKVDVQWSANDGVIVPATNSNDPAPAVNVDIASTLGHNAIPTDPGSAETVTSSPASGEGSPAGVAGGANSVAARERAMGAVAPGPVPHAAPHPY